MSEFDYDEFEYTPVAAPEPVKKPGVARSIADTGLSLARGVVTGGKMISDVAGAGNTVSNTLSNTAKSIGDLRSDYSKNLDTIASQRTKAAEDSGSTWEELKAGAKNFADRPIDMIAEGIGSSVPTLAAVAATRGRVNPFAAGAGMGAVQGVGEVKGEIYEGVKNAVGEERAKEAQSYLGPNTGQIALGAGLGAVAGSTGIEPAVGRMLGGTAKRGIKPIIANTISEGATEFAQGGQSKLATNVALQNEGIATPTWQGVAGQGIQEALAGAGSGAAFGVAEQLAPRQVEPQVTPEVQRQAEIEQVASTGPLGRAVATGMQEGVVPTPTEQQVMEEQARQQAINAISGRDFKGYTPSIEQQNQAEINAAERDGAFNTDTNILRQAVEARNQRLINMAEKRGAFESTWDKLEPAQREEMALQAGVPPIVAKAQSGREWNAVSESAKKPIINIFGERNGLQEQAPETAEEVIQEPATSTETPAGQPAATTETTPATPLPELSAPSQVTQQEPASLPVDGAARTLDEEGRATDGKPINPGDVFRTLSGRDSTPYPKQKSEKYASQWLIDNATEEAESRGDDFNARIFKNTKPMKDGTLTTADREGMLMYLFSQQPAVVPSILKKLTGAPNASPEVVTQSGEVQRADNEGSKVSGATGGNGQRAERSQGAGRTEPGDGTAVPMGTSVQGDTALADSVIQQETIALTRRRAAANETGLDATLSKAINKAKELIGRGHGESGALTSAWFNKAAKKFETARDNETAAHLRKIASRIKEIQAAKPINPPTESAVQEPARAIENEAPAVAAGVQAKKRKASNNLTQRIKQLGGINIRYRSDVISDNKGGPVGLFSKTGKGLDDLATELAAEGFEINTGDVDGGVGSLTDLLKEAVAGRTILNLYGQERARQEKLSNEETNIADAHEDFLDGIGNTVDEADGMRLLGFTEEEINAYSGTKVQSENASQGNGKTSEGSPRSSKEGGAFSLEGQTPEEVRAEEARLAAIREQEAYDRAIENAIGDTFTLTGSNRPADELAARGQQDIFSAPPASAQNNEILAMAKGKKVKLKAIVKETGQINEGTFDAVEEITRIRKEIDALDALKTCLGG